MAVHNMYLIYAHDRLSWTRCLQQFMQTLQHSADRLDNTPLLLQHCQVHYEYTVIAHASKRQIVMFVAMWSILADTLTGRPAASSEDAPHSKLAQSTLQSARPDRVCEAWQWLCNLRRQQNTCLHHSCAGALLHAKSAPRFNCACGCGACAVDANINDSFAIKAVEVTLFAF